MGERLQAGGLMYGAPYMSNPARESLMGREETTNPSPAAAYLLGRGRVATARRLLAKAGRRPFHRANPAPAVAAILGSGVGKAVLSKLGFKTGSARYEGGPLVSTVAGFLDAVKAGDLATVRRLHGLATSPAEKHRAAWASVWNTALPQLEGALPQAVQREIARLDPTSVFAARAKELTAAQAAAAARREAREEEQQERREGLLAGVASEVGKGLLGRGRGLPRRKKRRRTRAIWE